MLLVGSGWELPKDHAPQPPHPLLLSPVGGRDQKSKMEQNEARMHRSLAMIPTQTMKKRKDLRADGRTISGVLYSTNPTRLPTH